MAAHPSPDDWLDEVRARAEELLDAPLVTLDRRLAQAPGPRCAFLTPPE